MPDAIDHLKIMNNALARIAGGAIMAEDEDTDLAEQVAAVYYDRLDALLAMHGWSWAQKTYRLDRLPETADNGYIADDGRFATGYRHGFNLPGGRIGEPRKILWDPRQPNDPWRDFIIEADNLYADREALWASVTVRADPNVWHPLFRLALTTMLAAELCVPVTHDAALAEELRTVAEGSAQEGGRGGLIGRAMATDAALARRQAPLWRDPLTDARLR